MTSGTRILLAQIAPGLAHTLERLPFDKSRSIVARACCYVGAALAEPEPETRELLNALTTTPGLSEAQAAMARALATAADDRYFDLKEEQASEPEWAPWFHRARLFAAISIVCCASTIEDLLEAVYELSYTQDDPSAVIAIIESAAAES